MITPHQQKALDIAEAVINTAQAVANSFKDVPTTGKRDRRKVFIKSYNRRPLQKKKTALALAQTAIATYIGAHHVKTIMARPTPKYKAGA